MASLLLMLMSEDARSDFVLAAAGATLLPAVRGLAEVLPMYPASGLIADVLTIAWIAVILLLVPGIIGRHRQHGLAGYDLDGSRSAIRQGLVVASPLIVFGILRTFSVLGGMTSLAGFYAIPVGGSPALGGADIVDVVLRFVRVSVVIFGTVVYSGFMINRARDAFREVPISSVEALRTYGMGAAGVGLVSGLLMLVGGLVEPLVAFAPAVLVALMVLLADRLVDTGMSTTRASILAPAVATVALHVLSTGGVFGGNLVVGLWFGASGFGLMVVAATLAGIRATSFAWVVPVAAVAIWPTCMGPLSVLQIGSQNCLF